MKKAFWHFCSFVVKSTISQSCLLIAIAVSVFFNSNGPVVAEEMKVPFKIPYYRGIIERYQSSLPPFTTLFRDRYLNKDKCEKAASSAEGYGRHTGIDIAVNSGTNVIAPWYGKIKFAGSSGGFGGVVVLEANELPGLDPNEVRYFIFAHNKRWYVKTGDVISKEQFNEAKADLDGNLLTYRENDQNGANLGGIVIASTGGSKILNDPYRGTSTGAHSHFQGEFKYGSSTYWPNWPSWAPDKSPFYSDSFSAISKANVPDDYSYYRDNIDNACLFKSSLNPNPITEETYNDGQFPITAYVFNPLIFIQERTNIGKFGGGGSFGTSRDPESRIMYNDFFLFGGYEYFGIPANNSPFLGEDGIRVHEAWGRLTQDFEGGKAKSTLFVWNEKQHRFYPIFMGFRDLYFWMNGNGYDTGFPTGPEAKRGGSDPTTKFDASQVFENSSGNTYTFHYDDSAICVYATDSHEDEVPLSRKCWADRTSPELKTPNITNHFEDGIGGGGGSDPTDLNAKIDLVFLIDTTGSMGDDIAAAKASAVDIVNAISAQTNDYRIAVVDFEDFPYDPYGSAGCGDYMYHDVLNFSSNNSAIISAIQGLPLRCGNDWEEAHYSALMHVLQKGAVGGWRDNVKKVVIVMTDAPPHDPEPYTGYTSNDVKNAAIALDPAVIYPIVIGGDSTTTAYMESLAEGTGGKVFDAGNSGEVVQAIMSAIEVAFQSPTAVAGGPYSGTTGSSITFDANGSYDSDGTIVLYEWDWNNDGTFDINTTSPTITHLWSSKYSGAVRLRVTDNDGLTGIGTGNVNITVLGDLDGDSDVDNDDLKILNSYLNKPASSYPACDLNGDGKITVLDSRKLVLLCTRPRCATK